MYIEAGRVLSVIITDSGLIKNDIINVKKNISTEDLAKITLLLNRRLNNLTIEDINLVVINNIKKDLYGHDDIFNAIIPALYDSLSEEDSEEVYMEGASNIFDYPEFKDIDKAREFITLLYDKSMIKSILKDESDMAVSIGDENLITGIKDCSIITSVYKLGNKPLGSIAIIGPTRMQYSKVITLLTKVANEINEAISINIIDDR
jgi:heat-inducible transcriptional repressor